MEKKGNASDLECGIIVGARWASLTILEPADLLGFMLARQRTVEKNTHKKIIIKIQLAVFLWTKMLC